MNYPAASCGELTRMRLNWMVIIMKKNYVYSVMVLTILFFATAAFAADNKTAEIGIIDVQKVLRESKAAKKAQNIYKKDFETKRALLSAGEKEIQRLEEDFKENGKVLSVEARKEKEENLTKQVKDFRRLAADMDEELKKKDAELTRKLLAEIGRVVQTLLKKDQYTVIMQSDKVVAFDETVDITEKVIKLYDAEKE
jgi:outer membrane protein